jgi:polyphosphate kinase 2 (PPK2 family)
MFKFFLTVGKEEQAKRFKNRETDPLKQYKLSPVDKASLKRWDKYTVAKYSMLLASHTEKSPWTIVNSNNKKAARINVIKTILQKLEYPEKIKKSKLKISKDVIVSGDDEIVRLEKLITSMETKSK